MNEVLLIEVLFIVSLVLHIMQLTGVTLSLTFPHRRIWPPPRKNSWQFLMSWTLFYAPKFTTCAVAVVSWNSWQFPPAIRGVLGIPLFLMGVALTLWGFISLGIANYHGLTGGFKIHGPYRFTRNPQYLGSMISCLGLIFLVNSFYITILLSINLISYVFMVLSEESWLIERYGTEYLHYKAQTRRFL